MTVSVNIKTVPILATIAKLNPSVKLAIDNAVKAEADRMKKEGLTLLARTSLMYNTTRQLRRFR